ncbi:MAG: hypothetical protein NTW14_11735 [bacterium]|nr:hypothetical protein [bacterium]
MFDLRNFRFIVPPTLCLSLVALAIVLEKHLCLTQFIEYFHLKDLGVIFAGGVIILSLGVVIGSLSASVIRLIDFVRRVFGAESSLNALHRDGERKKLKEIYVFDNKEYIKQEEIATWCIISEFYPKEAKDWLRRRWEYHVINFNCLMSTLLSFLFCYFVLKNSTLGYLLICVVLLFIFGINAWQTFLDNVNSDRFILRNRDKIIERTYANGNLLNVTNKRENLPRRRLVRRRP